MIGPLPRDTFRFRPLPTRVLFGTGTRAALGWAVVPQPPIEAAIALSIVVVASEIVRAGRGATDLSIRFPWLIAFLFGLLHGFGFGGALRDIGLPQKDVPLALFTFNLGVEAGQHLSPRHRVPGRDRPFGDGAGKGKAEVGFDLCRDRADEGHRQPGFGVHDDRHDGSGRRSSGRGRVGGDRDGGECRDCRDQDEACHFTSSAARTTRPG